jgi:hypothetical protein
MHLQKLQLCKIATARYRFFADDQTDVVVQPRKRLLSAHHMYEDRFFVLPTSLNDRSRVS